jgi:hypothetical protein
VNAQPSDEPTEGPQGATPEPQPPGPEATHTYAVEPTPESAYMDYGPPPPGSYGVDGVRAMPRTPHSVFVYWELSGPQSAQVRKWVGPGCRWVLRLTRQPHGDCQDIETQPEACNYYLHDLRPGTRYVVAAGVIKDGVFIPVCRSREIRLPQDRPGEGPVVWADFSAIRKAGRRRRVVRMLRRAPVAIPERLPQTPGLRYKVTGKGPGSPPFKG